MGRDCWLAIPSNLWGDDSNGAYIKIYITSPNNTTVWVETDSSLDSLSVNAYKVSEFHVRESLEMESSGYPENKGIHIFSRTADIEAYFMSHEAYSSDGSYIIPTIGWGTDYVVAAYGSAFEGGGTALFDLPSECTIVADQDNTEVDITPSCDCRQCRNGNASGNAQSSIVVYPQGEPQSFPLNRGQSLQLMPVMATDPDNFDMTGTIIHSNKPIGVIGASMEPNIPLDYPYGDFVCEMIPPVRTWGKTYYATNPIQPPGSLDDFARYLFISSVPGQEIDRYDFATGSHTECVIPNQYEFYWDELESAQRFTSNEPFLCVWYINSSTFPGGNNGNGDPAECVINPKEQYTTSVVFQTPQVVGGNFTPYTNYADLIVADKDAKFTTFDGNSITVIGHFPLDGVFSVYNVPRIAPGTHTVVQDLLKDSTAQGVGVYMYGYGFDESYAWASPAGVSTPHSPDTVAPRVETITACYQTFVHVADSGQLPDTIAQQSGLNTMRLDTAYNMAFLPNADWLDGSGTDTSGYTATVLDPTKEGFLRVDVYDLAGNLTTVTTAYKTNYATIEPTRNNLGVWYNSNPPITSYDTIYNLGETPFKLDILQLLKGDVGFSIYDSVGGSLDLSPINPGGRRVITVKFQAVQTRSVVDSLLFGSACNVKGGALLGSGGAADFVVSSQTWSNEPLGNCYAKTVTIENLSSGPITIDSAWWPDQVHFKAVSTTVFSIPPMGSVPITIEYCPDSNSWLKHDSTQGNWFSNSVRTIDGQRDSARYDELVGWAAAPSGVDAPNDPSLNASIIPTNNGRSLEIILPSDVASPINFELVNVLGESVLRSSFTGTHSIDVSVLPRGVYFYRLTSNGATQNGKVLLGQ